MNDSNHTESVCASAEPRLRRCWRTRVACDQHGHHFEHIVVLEIPRRNLIKLMEEVNALIGLWSMTTAEDDEAQQMEEELLPFMKENLIFCRLPIITLASGLQALRHKFYCVMYFFSCSGGYSHFIC